MPYITFTSFSPTEIIEEKNLLEKIPNIGNYPELAQAFYRIRTSQKQYNTACEERNFLIKRFLSLPKMDDKLTYALDRLTEIHQRTTVMLAQGEAILDGLTFIAQELFEIHSELRNDFRNRGIKGVKLSRLPKHPYWDKFRIQLRNVVDSMQGTGRHLHMPRERN